MKRGILIGLGSAGLAATLAVLSGPVAGAGHPAVFPSDLASALPAPPYASTVTADQLPGVIQAALDKATPTQREMLLNMVAQQKAGELGPGVCFAPGTPNEVVSAFNARLGFDKFNRFNQIPRWFSTATNGPTGGQGDPITLTYSFVPDGTPMPSGAGEAPAPSDMFAFFNSIYGVPSVWQALFDNVFQRWGELSGVTYVFEPNDDGASQGNFPGVIGVRGDVRISGHFIDGPFGILAYNFFPDTGDMVLDTGDSFFTAMGGNSIRLRNVVSHEHGHGMGQLHVCPILQTKLMEPFVTTIFDGPRHDDIRNAQRHYGDRFEPDNFAAQANNALGTIAVGSFKVIGTPTPPSVAFGSILSIDADAEQDYFAFTVNGPGMVTATVSPLGTTYDDSVQSSACQGQGNCCSGSFTNSRTIANLRIEVIDTDGVTVLGTAVDAAIGLSDQIKDVPLPLAGQYFIRVFEASTPISSQLYTLTVVVNAAVVPPCPGDANGDGVVNFADITSVVANWLTAGPAGDANHDGIVNFADITEVVANWLVPCP